MQGFHTLVCVSVDLLFGEAGGWSINNSDESQMNGKTNGGFYSGFSANAALPGNHRTDSTELQLGLKVKGVCQVGENIFLLGFTCLRQTQRLSPKSGKLGQNSGCSMTKSIYLKCKGEKQEQGGMLLIPRFRTEITLGNCFLVQKVCSKYIRQVSQSDC